MGGGARPPRRGCLDQGVVTSGSAIGSGAFMPALPCPSRDLVPGGALTTGGRSNHVRPIPRRVIRLLPFLQRPFGREGREQVHQAGDDPRPAGLMAGPEPGAVVALEILIEQQAIAPVRVLLEGTVAAEDRAATVRAPQEQCG